MATFIDRHIGPRNVDISPMLKAVGATSLESLLDETIPESIRSKKPLNLPKAISERESLEQLKNYAETNEIWRSYIGLGYHNCITPSVILRNLLENPGYF